MEIIHWIISITFLRLLAHREFRALRSATKRLCPLESRELLKKFDQNFWSLRGAVFGVGADFLGVGVAFFWGFCKTSALRTTRRTNRAVGAYYV